MDCKENRRKRHRLVCKVLVDARQPLRFRDFWTDTLMSGFCGGDNEAFEVTEKLEFWVSQPADLPEVSRGNPDGKTATIRMRTPASRRRHDRRGVIVAQEVAAF